MSSDCHGSKGLAAEKVGGHYNIGQAARLTGITAKMIRHYEQLRLIPKAARSANDYRTYGDKELHMLKFIRRARTLGFSIKAIANLLNLWQNQRRASAEVKDMALKHIQELDQRIAELQTMKAALTQLTLRCHGDDRPDCPILDDLAEAQVSPSRKSRRTLA